jgi:chromosome partitioning protein
MEKRPMHVVAILNQKGGSGKTTTAVNLAAALGELGRRVLLVDLDPQASASRWLAVDDSVGGLYDVVVQRAPLEPHIRPTAVTGVDLVPARQDLAAAELEARRKPGAELVLRQALGRLPPRWDTALLDCPPSLGLLTVNALAAADEVLVPVEAHILALEGLADLLGTMDLVREALNPRLRLGGVLACRVSRTRHTRDVTELLRQQFPDTMLTSVVRESARLAEAPAFKKPILTYASDSPGALDYRAAAAEWQARAPQLEEALA